MAIVDVIAMNTMNTDEGTRGDGEQRWGQCEEQREHPDLEQREPQPDRNADQQAPQHDEYAFGSRSRNELGRVGAHGAKDRELAAAFEHEECAKHGDSDGGDQRGSERLDATEPREIQCGEASLERVSDRCHAESIGQGSAEFGGHRVGRSPGRDAGEVEVRRAPAPSAVSRPST